MNQCERVTTLLGDFVGGDLPAAVHAGVVRHLTACTGCRAEAGHYRAVIRLAGSLPPPAPPPAAESRLLAALRAAAGRPRCGGADDTELEVPALVDRP